MFNKIEIWILYLLALLSIPLTICFGTLVKYELIGGTKLKPLSKTALFLADIPFKLKEITLRSDLEVNDDRSPNLSGFDGTPNSNESYILLSRYDSDLEEGIVELIDLKTFMVLHTWNPKIDEFNNSIKKIDEFKYLDRDHNNSRARLIHPKLTKDGGLLFNASALRKIDNCSRLIFQNTKDSFHHSIETDLEGNLWVPSRLYPQSLPKKKVGRSIHGEKKGFYDDAIVKLSSDGKIVFEKSISQIFIDNGLEYLLFSVGSNNIFNVDPIHLNDIQPVDFNGPYWRKGDLFLSLKNQSMIILYRPSTNKIIWKGTGPFFNQHDVDILDENRISIFNNNSKQFAEGYTVDGNNEIIIFNFKTKKYETYMSDSLKRNQVKTINEGRSEILKNGDLIIEESSQGKTLYYNSDGSLRWTYVNRGKNGKVYRVGWSRIIYNPESIIDVNNFIKSKDICND